MQEGGTCQGSVSNPGLPPPPSNQITLLKYFRNYMSEHLLKAGANITPREGDELARLPYLRTWFRTRSAIILHLSNGSVQINFFQVNRGGEELGRDACAWQRAPRVGLGGAAWDPSLASGGSKRVGGWEPLIGQNASPPVPHTLAAGAFSPPARNSLPSLCPPLPPRTIPNSSCAR